MKATGERFNVEVRCVCVGGFVSVPPSDWRLLREGIANAAVCFRKNVQTIGASNYAVGRNRDCCL